MKRYTINCHYDMVISVDVIADNEQQAIELAKLKAEDIDLKEAECVGRSECVTDTEELTAEKLQRMEREAVTEFVRRYVGDIMADIDQYSQKRNLHRLFKRKLSRIAYGVRPIRWYRALSGIPAGHVMEEWLTDLYKRLTVGTHERTELYNRYARMVARQRWEQVADDLRAQWAKAFSEAKADPKGTRVIVETNEGDPTAPDNEFGRYYMVDFWQEDGLWHIIRVDIVTSPFEVHRPNFAAANGHRDNETQLACRCENPNNVTRWARKMIDAGRVTDIYADCY